MYRLDLDDWTELSGNTLEVSDVGSHVISFYSVDVAGNEETASSIEFKVDMSAPVTTAYG